MPFSVTNSHFPLLSNEYASLSFYFCEGKVSLVLKPYFPATRHVSLPNWHYLQIFSKKKKCRQLETANHDFCFLKMTYHDSCLRFVCSFFILFYFLFEMTSVIDGSYACRMWPCPVINIQKLKSMHGVILKVNGCWNKKTLQRVPTHV